MLEALCWKHKGTDPFRGFDRPCLCGKSGSGLRPRTAYRGLRFSRRGLLPEEGHGGQFRRHPEPDRSGEKAGAERQHPLRLHRHRGGDRGQDAAHPLGAGGGPHQAQHIRLLRRQQGGRRAVRHRKRPYLLGEPSADGHHRPRHGQDTGPHPVPQLPGQRPRIRFRPGQRPHDAEPLRLRGGGHVKPLLLGPYLQHRRRRKLPGGHLHHV